MNTCVQLTCDTRLGVGYKTTSDRDHKPRPQKGAVLKQQSRRKVIVSIVLATSFKLTLMAVFVAVKTS